MWLKSKISMMTYFCCSVDRSYVSSYLKRLWISLLAEPNVLCTYLQWQMKALRWSGDYSI